MENTFTQDYQVFEKENFFISVIFNIIIPVFLLSKLSGESFLGPYYGLMLALAFPFAYGLYEYVNKRKKNIISALGFISILLTGVVGLFKFPPEMIAVKEAAIPFIIGVVNLISLRSKYPFIKTVILNKELVDIEKIENAVNNGGRRAEFEKIIARSSIYLSCSFFFSALLNFILAKIIVQGMPGTIQFNQELGKMVLLSYPVIALPSVIILFFILRYLLVSVKKLTGLTSKEIFVGQFNELFAE